MKKFLTGILIMAAPALFAANANQMKYVNVLPSNGNTGTAVTVTSDYVDVAAYKGNAAFVVSFGKGNTNACTNVVTITHCATSGGSYATITNLAGTAAVVTTKDVVSALTTYPCDLARLNKYIKASYTTAGANATNTACSVIMVAPMKSE